MNRALVVLLLALATTPAVAQSQTWSPDNGWNTDIDRQTKQLDDAYQKRVADMRRDHDDAVRKMDQDFDRSTKFFWVFFVGIIVLGFGGVIAGAVRKRRALAYSPVIESVMTPAYVAQLPSGNVDVSVIRLGVDGRAGKLVASELDRLSKQYETTSAEGRSALLRELGVVLRRVRAAWQFGGAVNEPMRSPGEAQGVAAKHVDDARVHGSDVGEGTGIVIVTIVVTARGELMSVDHVGAEELRRALEAAAYRDPNELLGIDVVARRFASADELRDAYPAPQIVPLAAPGGNQVFCTYCGAPFPMELTTCPQCGAPAKKDRAA